MSLSPQTTEEILLPDLGPASSPIFLVFEHDEGLIIEEVERFIPLHHDFLLFIA